ncbi:MAG: DNA cytosine methyltransferase [Ruminococcus callidus]
MELFTEDGFVGLCLWNAEITGFRKDQFEKVAATGMSDAQLYKQAGNSITVAVVEAIARNLLKFDEEVSSGKYH